MAPLGSSELGEIREQERAPLHGPAKSLQAREQPARTATARGIGCVLAGAGSGVLVFLTERLISFQNSPRGANQAGQVQNDCDRTPLPRRGSLCARLGHPHLPCRTGPAGRHAAQAQGARIPAGPGPRRLEGGRAAGGRAAGGQLAEIEAARSTRGSDRRSSPAVRNERLGAGRLPRCGRPEGVAAACEGGQRGGRTDAGGGQARADRRRHAMRLTGGTTER